MRFFCISGSARKHSKNIYLLKYLQTLIPEHEFKLLEQIEMLPVFFDGSDYSHPLIIQLRKEIIQCDGVIVSAPEYLHDVPAALKNIFEWMNEGSYLGDKKIIALTYTPVAPRGEKAIASLLNILKALKTNTLTSLSLYHTDIQFKENGRLIFDKTDRVLTEMINLFTK